MNPREHNTDFVCPHFLFVGESEWHCENKEPGHHKHWLRAKKIASDGWGGDQYDADPLVEWEDPGA